MWKWIGGILLVVVLLFVGASWWGYRTLTSGGDSVSLMIAGTPERVFASMAHHDSLASWWMIDDRVPANVRHGPIAEGDTMPPDAAPTTLRRRPMTWMVSDVVPGRLLVLSARMPSSGQLIATRRDSLVSMGDSTMIVSTIASPMMDSLRVGSDTDSKSKEAILDMSSKVLVSSLRVAAKLGLTRLKNHIEGRPSTSVRP